MESSLRIRITRTHEVSTSEERIREFYVYGKTYNSIIMEASNLCYDVKPLDVYLNVHSYCRMAVLYIMWAFRREFHWPRDVCKMLAQMVWHRRERDAAEWYMIK